MDIKSNTMMFEVYVNHLKVTINQTLAIHPFYSKWITENEKLLYVRRSQANYKKSVGCSPTANLPVLA